MMENERMDGFMYNVYICYKKQIKLYRSALFVYLLQEKEMQCAFCCKMLII